MQTPRVLIYGAAALMAAGLSAGGACAATAREGQVFLQARSVLQQMNPATDPQSDGWSGLTPRDMSIASAATTTLGNDSIFTHGGLDAHWDSANSGSVTIDSYGWIVNATDPSITSVETGLFNGSDGQPDWSYQFTAAGHGSFDLTSDFFGSGASLFGLGGWEVLFSDGVTTTTTRLTSGYSGSPSGEITAAFSHALLSGHTYTVSLKNLVGFGTFGVTTSASVAASENGRFDWSITDPVPEPSTWALSILGFGLAGAALRRRRLAIPA